MEGKIVENVDAKGDLFMVEVGVSVPGQLRRRDCRGARKRMLRCGEILSNLVVQSVDKKNSQFWLTLRGVDGANVKEEAYADVLFHIADWAGVTVPSDRMPEVAASKAASSGKDGKAGRGKAAASGKGGGKASQTGGKADQAGGNASQAGSQGAKGKGGKGSQNSGKGANDTKGAKGDKGGDAKHRDRRRQIRDDYGEQRQQQQQMPTARSQWGSQSRWDEWSSQDSWWHTEATPRQQSSWGSNWNGSGDAWGGGDTSWGGQAWWAQGKGSAWWPDHANSEQYRGTMASVSDRSWTQGGKQSGKGGRYSGKGKKGHQW